MRDDKIKSRSIIYVSIFAIILIGISIVSIVLSNDKNEPIELKQTELADLNEIYEENTTEASSQTGKTVNEVKEENKVALNTEKEVNKNTTSSNTAKSTNTTTSKNTTKTETKKVEKKKVEFEEPVKGEIIKEYAKDNLIYSNTLNEWTTHLGIDIKADKTTVVKSAYEGTVESIKNDPRYGLTVIIEHDDGFKTVYSNLLTSEFVVEGEKVKTGQTIGTVGNTATFESKDESHLHFEILKDNEQVDPTLYVYK